MSKIIWELPLKTRSEANCAEHWTAKSKRHRHQQFFIRSLFLREVREIPIPCTVTMIRIGPRFLDEDDNLRMAFKWIKDEIGACLLPEKVVYFITKKGARATNKGHADSDPRVKWKYSQEKGPRQAIRIEFESWQPEKL